MTFLHLVRAESYAQSQGPSGRLLSLTEARACAPTSGPVVQWSVVSRRDSRAVSVFAEAWSEARALGARQLALPVDAVSCERQNSEELLGEGRA